MPMNNTDIKLIYLWVFDPV